MRQSILLILFFLLLPLLPVRRAQNVCLIAPNLVFTGDLISTACNPSVNVTLCDIWEATVNAPRGCSNDTDCTAGTACQIPICQPTFTCAYKPIFGCCTQNSDCPLPADPTCYANGTCNTATHTCAYAVRDKDGDGVICTLDCDDTDPLILGGTQRYPDADADGFGSPRNPIISCTLPTGYSDYPTDCYDGDPDRFPGAVQLTGWQCSAPQTLPPSGSLNGTSLPVFVLNQAYGSILDFDPITRIVGVGVPLYTFDSALANRTGIIQMLVRNTTAEAHMDYVQLQLLEMPGVPANNYGLGVRVALSHGDMVISVSTTFKRIVAFYNIGPANVADPQTADFKNDADWDAPVGGSGTLASSAVDANGTFFVVSGVQNSGVRAVWTYKRGNPSDGTQTLQGTGVYNNYTLLDTLAAPNDTLGTSFFGRQVAMWGRLLVVTDSVANTSSFVGQGLAYVYLRSSPGGVDHYALVRVLQAPAHTTYSTLGFGSNVLLSNDTLLVGYENQADGAVRGGFFTWNYQLLSDDTLVLTYLNDLTSAVGSQFSTVGVAGVLDPFQGRLGLMGIAQNVTLEGSCGRAVPMVPARGGWWSFGNGMDKRHTSLNCTTPAGGLTPNFGQATGAVYQEWDYAGTGAVLDTFLVSDTTGAGHLYHYRCYERPLAC